MTNQIEGNSFGKYFETSLEKQGSILEFKISHLLYEAE
jgi:hypothetical protein